MAALISLIVLALTATINAAPQGCDSCSRGRASVNIGLSGGGCYDNPPYPYPYPDYRQPTCNCPAPCDCPPPENYCPADQGFECGACGGCSSCGGCGGCSSCGGCGCLPPSPGGLLPSLPRPCDPPLPSRPYNLPAPSSYQIYETTYPTYTYTDYRPQYPSCDGMDSGVIYAQDITPQCDMTAGISTGGTVGVVLPSGGYDLSYCQTAPAIANMINPAYRYNCGIPGGSFVGSAGLRSGYPAY